MTANSLLRVGIAVALLAGCSHKRIPGTDIEDTSETRAILLQMEKYRAAVEAKDVEAIRGLVDASFKDEGGSTAPDDDLNYANLADRLNERFSKVDNLRLEIEVKKIQVDDETETAMAVYLWTLHYQLPSLTTKPQIDSELKQMAFKLVDKSWKIVSGI